MEDLPQPEASAPKPETEPTGDAMFDALWGRVLEAWDDEKTHQALLDYAIRSQRLPDAAGKYRAVKDADPERAAKAQKKLDGIVIAATHMLMAMKTPPARYKVPVPITLTAFAIAILVLGYLTWAVMMRRHG